MKSLENTWIRRIVVPLAVLLGALVSALRCEEEGGRSSPYEESMKEIARAQKAVDPDAFLAAFVKVVQVDDSDAVRDAVAVYSRFAPVVMKKLGTREFLSIHGKAAAAFAAVKDKKATDEFRKLLVSAKAWEGRLLLLDASSFSRTVDILDSAMTALRDESPVVIRRALQYLSAAKKPAVAGAIIQRYVAISKTRPKGMDATQHKRLCLVFQATLHAMLHRDLPSPEDYKTYFEARQNDPNLFEARSGGERGATLVTLFGAPVTGKNLVFVLDISGSMTKTDPRPAGEVDPDQGKTVVDDPSRPGRKKGPSPDRQRMVRAKKELSNVVRSLAEDIRFNIVTYSSDVNTWKKSMVFATAANKKSAVEYVDGLAAEGLTFTDEAMEVAFSDLEADTVYLVTDGAPTHVESTTARKAPDTDELVEQILKRVEELNFLRGVRVYTLGFEGAEEEFLKNLASKNSGTYTRIR
jgi:hypothetical protein